MKKIISSVLSCILLFYCAIPGLSVSIQKRGSIGDNVTYELYYDGTLRIKGTGKMYSWEWNSSPFFGNGRIKKVIIEKGVESVGSGAFSRCRNLKEVTLPRGLKVIENYAFYDCNTLYDVPLPLTAESIGIFAFCFCYGLKDICIPDSMEKIGFGAFSGCTGLEKIYIGTGLETVETDAFAGCTGLKKLYIRDYDLYKTVDFIKKEGQESFFALKPIEIKTGDADLDGLVSAADARLILRYSVNLEDMENVPFNDMDRDFDVTASDARLILRFSVGLGKCRFHSYRNKEVTLDDGTGEIHRVCTICGRDTDAIPEVGGKMGQTFAGIFSYYGAMSAGVGIVEDGELTATYTYGWADKASGRKFDSDTKLRAASTSKLLVCITFMAMKDAGLVDDKADISDYFGYRCRNPYYPNDKITPSMIMTHSSSINGGYTNGGSFYLPDYALSTYAPYWHMKPGSMYEYCNAGLGVLACIMERVTGKYLSELTREYVFDKMGIDAAFDAAHLADPDKIGCLYGGLTAEQVKNIVSRDLGHSLNLASGNLLISPKDYARVLAMLINDGRAEDGTVILSPESVEEIEKIRIYEDYSRAPGAYGVGYGIQLEDTVLPGKNVFVHIGSGRGVHSTYVYMPEERRGIYIMTTGCEHNLDPDCEVYRVCLDIIRAYYG